MESLTARTIRQLQARITNGSLKPGDKLSTLNELCQQMGVSRTVIREAVAALSSEGMLETRHGVGVFVVQPRMEATAQNNGTLRQFSEFDGPFLDMLELRMAFEVHAAGMAAQRRSLAQEAAIWAAVQDFEAARHDDTVLDDLDFRFHSAIIQATNNAAFIEFFALMGHRILPDATLSRERHPDLVNAAYIEHSVQEHREICNAISEADANAARAAMQAHLDRSHLRYRGIGVARD